MLKILKITKTAEYQKISKNNEKFYSQSLILLRAKTPEFYNFNKESGKNAEEFCRFGVTASKKVGNAVTRNRAKRSLREAVKQIFPQHGKAGFDYVIIAKTQIKDVDFAKETTAMTKSQILQQASSSILAQAKQAPNAALGLLG